jgi:hypothetical protein
MNRNELENIFYLQQLTFCVYSMYFGKRISYEMQKKSLPTNYYDASHSD